MALMKYIIYFCNWKPETNKTNNDYERKLDFLFVQAR